MKKSEIIAEINPLAEKLGLDIEVSEDQTSKELTNILKDLKAKAKDEATETVVDVAEQAKEEAEAKEPEVKTAPETEEEPETETAPEEPENGSMIVAKGKSLVTKAGIKGPGDTVTPDMMGGAGAAARMEELKKKGYFE